MSHELWAASCILLLLGLMAFVSGSILGWLHSRRKQPRGVETEARVVEILPIKRDPSVMSEFRNRQAAVFEFFASGRLIKITDETDRYPCPYRLHQRVRIRYNPDNPKEYCVVGFDPCRSGAAALRITGIVLLLAGCVLFFLYASRKTLN